MEKGALLGREGGRKRAEEQMVAEAVCVSMDEGVCEGCEEAWPKGCTRGAKRHGRRGVRGARGGMVEGVSGTMGGTTCKVELKAANH